MGRRLTRRTGAANKLRAHEILLRSRKHEGPYAHVPTRRITANAGNSAPRVD